MGRDDELPEGDREALAKLLDMTPEQLKQASDQEAREFAEKWRRAFGNRFAINRRLRKSESLAKALHNVRKKARDFVSRMRRQEEGVADMRDDPPAEEKAQRVEEQKAPADVQAFDIKGLPKALQNFSFHPTTNHYHGSVYQAPVYNYADGANRAAVYQAAVHMNNSYYADGAIQGAYRPLVLDKDSIAELHRTGHLDDLLRSYSSSNGNNVNNQVLQQQQRHDGRDGIGGIGVREDRGPNGGNVPPGRVPGLRRGNGAGRGVGHGAGVVRVGQGRRADRVVQGGVQPDRVAGLGRGDGTGRSDKDGGIRYRQGHGAGRVVQGGVSGRGIGVGRGFEDGSVRQGQVVGPNRGVEVVHAQRDRVAGLGRGRGAGRGVGDGSVREGQVHGAEQVVQGGAQPGHGVGVDPGVEGVHARPSQGVGDGRGPQGVLGGVGLGQSGIGSEQAAAQFQIDGPVQTPHPDSFKRKARELPASRSACKPAEQSQRNRSRSPPRRFGGASSSSGVFAPAVSSSSSSSGQPASSSSSSSSSGYDVNNSASSSSSSSSPRSRSSSSAPRRPSTNLSAFSSSSLSSSSSSTMAPPDVDIVAIPSDEEEVADEAGDTDMDGEVAQPDEDDEDLEIVPCFSHKEEGSYQNFEELAQKLHTEGLSLHTDKLENASDDYLMQLYMTEGGMAHLSASARGRLFLLQQKLRK